MTIKSLRARLNGWSTAHVVNSNDYQKIENVNKCMTSNVVNWMYIKTKLTIKGQRVNLS